MKHINSHPNAQPTGAALKMRLLGLELSPMAVIGLLVATILAIVVLLGFAAYMLAMVMQWSDASEVARILDVILR